MQPLYSALIVFLSSTGSVQWFVGPASSSFFEAINVRLSTRATSEGSERNKKLFFRFFKGVANFTSTNFFISRSYSAAEPSHTYTLSGVHSAVTSSTHLRASVCLSVSIVIVFPPKLTGVCINYIIDNNRNIGFLQDFSLFVHSFLTTAAFTA